MEEVKWRKTFPLLFVFFVFTQVVYSKSGFILTAPKSLTLGRNNILNLHLFDINTNGFLRIGVKDQNDGNVVAETEVSFSKDKPSNSIQLTIPSGTEVKQPRLYVNGSYSSPNSNDFFFEKNIKVNKDNLLIFVQTDKPLYKPGQRVKVRVLPTTPDLKLVPKETVGSFQIENPDGIVLGYWPMLSFADGIVQFELALPDEPTYGMWRIKGNIENTEIYENFEVKEYVLPKFEVKITPPSYLLSNADSITWKICAQYTYGQPVEGTFEAKTNVVQYHWEKEGVPVIHKEGLIDGCIDVTVSSSDIGFNESRLSYRAVNMFAEVTEKGTGIKMKATASIHRTFDPLNIMYLQPTSGERYLKPGLPFYGKLKVEKPDGTPAPGEQIEICRFADRERWNRKRWLEEKIRACKEFTSDETGIVKFTVPPQTPDITSLRFKAKSLRFGKKNGKDSDNKLNQPEHFFTVSSWYSPSGSHLQLEPITEKIECGKPLTVKFKYTTGEEKKIKFYYQIMARNFIVDTGSFEHTFLLSEDKSGLTDDTYLPVDVSALSLNPPNEPEWENNVIIPPHIGEASLTFIPNFEMTPSAKLLVFYVREDGETVADSTKITIKKCLRNKVGLKFKEDKVLPGASSTLQLTASPDSVCGIGAVDKSVHILSSDNRITEEKVYNELGGHDYYWPRQATPDYEYCQNYKFKQAEGQQKVFISPGFTSTNYLDSITAFDEAGLVVISDMQLETRPCKPSDFEDGGRPCPQYNEFIPVAFAAPQSANRIGGAAGPDGGFGGSGVVRKKTEKPVVDIRTYFPETWLWEIQNIGATGELNLKRNIPHTITEWVGSAICISGETGLGVSEAATVKGFQPFFVSFTLPYSVIRGEKVPIIVTVFNYLSECLPIKLSLEQSEKFEIQNDTNSYTSCVCGGKSDTTRWMIKPLSLGQVNLTVYGTSLPNEAVCGNQDYSTVTAHDAATRQLLVEPEGFPKEDTWSTFACPKDQNGKFTATSDLLLPDDLVEGSARGYVSVTGDLMGPAIKNIDHLVRLPTGCGEQNMVKFVPNIFVLDYLTATESITDSIKEKALNNMRKGYARQQKYRHPDGSYSAFGDRDKEGNLFLTAFVYRSFSQAERFILIDKKNLDKTEDWILNRQRSNGCFRKVGKLFNKALQGGISSNDETPAPLTAYVLISLLEAGYKNDTVIDQGIRCLNALSNPSTYSLALFAYATSLADHPSAKDYLTKLFERAITEGGKTFWKSPSGGRYYWGNSIGVEVAGYAVLTLLQHGGASNMAKATPIIRWLAKQQNYRGGFYSTQDTVIALQAMSKFAAIIYKDELNLEIGVKSSGFEKKFMLTKDNSILMQTFRLPTVPSPVDFEATGSGCGLVQTSLRYNVNTPPPVKGFHLDITTKRGLFRDCIYARIDICAKYDGKGGVSNMAVLELKMVSGWIPDETSIKNILNREELNLRRYEVEENKLNLYFSELTDQKQCFNFWLEQDIEVQETKPATIRLYDYYEQEEEVVTSYSIGENCEKLPPLP
ncbi:alpha-2-macroglobulin-like isoform X2 [Tachypleus tridentatus]|uniref:alpha-2-macroglobulin-like isoform X2 n=1 Tax=Tachypleus tridentatus TaxID=6853 RepID=UPI003FD10CC4